MAERKLNVVVTASLEKLRAELAKGEAIIGTTSNAMKRMGDAYDGSRTVANANAAMLQIEKLGGVTRLTEAEQRKLHNTLSEGVAKYQAMGQTAPASMLAMRDATAKLESTTGSLVSNVKSLAGSLGLAFGASAVIGGLKSMVSGALDFAEAIKDTSTKMGVSMEATQRWKFAAEQTGATLENVSKSVLKLSQGIAGDDKSLRAALAQAGVEMDSLKGKKPEEAFNIVADAIAKIPDPMVQARVALEAFGKSGAELLPALRDGFTELANSAKVMSDSTIERLDKAKDAWERLKNSVVIWTGEMIGNQIAINELTDQQRQHYIALVKNGGDAQAFLNGIAKANKDAAEKTREHAAEAAALSGSYMNAQRNLAPIPPLVKDVGDKHEKAAVQVNKFKTSLPGVKEGDQVRAFFDAIRVGGNEFTTSLPGVTANVGDFMSSLRIGNEEIQSFTTSLSGLADKGVGGFLDSIEARNDDLRSVGSRVGDSLKEGFSESMKGLGNIIVGAIQGGGDVAKAAGAYIGSSIGNSMAKNMEESLNKALGKTMGGLVGGLLGPLGALAGSWLGGLFGGNNTKEDREKAAKMFGFSSLEGLNNALRGMGEEGNRLVHEGLNVIGKNDTAANQQWIRDVKELLAKQKEAVNAGAKAVEDAASREVVAHNKVKEAIQSKIDLLDNERESVFNSIRDELEAPEYDEAGNRIYGVIEAQGLARLEEIDKQKAALAVQMAEASAKVMDEAVIVRAGIEEIFKEPIRVTFDWSDAPKAGAYAPSPVPAPGGGGGGWSGGGSGGGAPATSRMMLPVILNIEGREAARAVVPYIPYELELMGAS